MATQEISRPITPHRNPYAESSQQIEDFSREAWRSFSARLPSKLWRRTELGRADAV